jgi:hypothetical protein
VIASASTSRALVPTCWLSASALLAFVLAALPLLVWYGRRMSDGSDEPLGVIALVAAGVIFLTAARFGRRDPGELGIMPARMMAGAAVLASLQFGGRGFSPLITGVLAVAILAVSVRMPRGKAGVIALLVLSLPLIASLDFFAGYPLRLAIASMSAANASVTTSACKPSITVRACLPEPPCDVRTCTASPAASVAQWRAKAAL